MFDLDLLTYDPDTPGFYGILLATLCSFFLSSLIAVIYDLTTVSPYRRAHFLQSLVLIGMVAALIMQAIGDSVARGLGILGALSIIRFRNAMEDPRNVTFIFASLGVGIAAGVLGLTVALTGTLVFCLAAVVLRFSPLRHQGTLIGDLRIRAVTQESLAQPVRAELDRHCRFHRLDQLREVGAERRRWQANYTLRLKPSDDGQQLTAALHALAGVEDVRIRFRHETGRL